MGGFRGKLLDCRNIVGQRRRRVRPAIDEAREHDRNEERADGAVQIVELILQRPAPIMRDDEAEREHEQNQGGGEPMERASRDGVGRNRRCFGHRVTCGSPGQRNCGRRSGSGFEYFKRHKGAQMQDSGALTTPGSEMAAIPVLQISCPGQDRGGPAES